MVIHDFLDYWARERPNGEFAVQGSRRLTYREARAGKWSGQRLRRRRTPIGDRVAVLGKNSLETPSCITARPKQGGASPLNYRLSPPEWRYIINDAQARLLLATSEYVAAVEEFRSALETVERFVTIDALGAMGWRRTAHLRQDKLSIVENEGILHGGNMCPSRPQEKPTMQLPLTNPDTLFEGLLQDLPPETAQMAREFKAFVRAKKVQTPEQLLRVVFLYCGLDKSLREVAGTFTALYEAITDQSVAERLRACGPWVQAMLRRMLSLSPVDTLPTG